MHIAIRLRSVGLVLATAGAVLSATAASAQPLAMTDPSSRYPASIFQEVMPQDSLVAECPRAHSSATANRELFHA
jgi:hypothetical protein